ncbi:hypothetical protein LINPERHAP1_LOCUS40012 [Linum perenne]
MILFCLVLQRSLSLRIYCWFLEDITMFLVKQTMLESLLFYSPVILLTR